MGDWVNNPPDQGYSTRDVVYHNGSSWICTLSHQQMPGNPFEPGTTQGNEVWDLMALSGTSGSSGSSGSSGTSGTSPQISGTINHFTYYDGTQVLQSAVSLIYDPVTYSISVSGGDLNVYNPLKIYEPTGTYYTSFVGNPSQAANIIYTLPASGGQAGDVLINDGSGNLYWGGKAVDAYTNTYTMTTSGSWVVEHNLGTTAVMVQCWDTDETPPQVIQPIDIEATNNNTVTVWWAEPVNGRVVVFSVG